MFPCSNTHHATCYLRVAWFVLPLPVGPPAEPIAEQMCRLHHTIIKARAYRSGAYDDVYLASSFLLDRLSEVAGERPAFYDAYKGHFGTDDEAVWLADWVGQHYPAIAP